MPHDRNGKPLAVGDRVNIPAIVRDVQPGDDYCNVRLETIEPMHPGPEVSTMYLNARQVEKSEPPTVAGVSA